MKKTLPLLLLLGAAIALSKKLPVSPVGMDPERLQRIGARMQQFVDAGEIAGAVTLVQRHGVIADLHAVGFQDLETRKPMRTDSIFEVMSMTKPVTSVAAMMLVEEGRLVLLDPVSKYLPEFAGSPITVVQLMTHTSGMPEMPPKQLEDLYRKYNVTLADAVAQFAKQPLDFKPGTSWHYSNTGMATLGRIVEVLSHQPYERFVSERILRPLGMNDTFYFPPEDKLGRIASLYSRKDGKLQNLGTGIYRKGGVYPMPEGGLYSTATDMAAFYQMMLNGGAYRGKRLLSHYSVETMTTPHSGDFPVWGSPAHSYGLGWAVNRAPGSTLNFQSLGSFGHGGAFGTQGLVDPRQDLVTVLMIQRFPSDNDEIRSDFQQIANSAVLDRGISGHDAADPKTYPIHERMQSFADQQQVAGTVTLYAQHGTMRYLDAAGFQDLEEHKPMRKDTIFQIMSMTKPITSVGILMLAEEGKLAVADPVERYLPEFHGSKITIKHLLTHTSGMPAAQGAYQDIMIKMDHPLAESVTAFAKLPLAFEPGTKWLYSNTGMATLGRIIEVVSGQPYEQFIERRILKPLDMVDTFYSPPADKIGRIALVYREDNGKLVPAVNILGGNPRDYRKGTVYPMPEAGLFSTATDQWHFYQTMLNGGTWNGTRILSPATIATMSEVQTGTIRPAGWLPGGGFGLGWEVARDPIGTLSLCSLGTYGHGGAFGTQAWIDAKKDMVGILMQAREGGFPTARDAYFAMASASVQ